MALSQFCSFGNSVLEWRRNNKRKVNIMADTLFLLGKSDYPDPDECLCGCHQNDGPDDGTGPPRIMVEHVAPCCETCKHCGKRIMIGAMILHLADCPENSERVADEPPEWATDRQFDDISHVDTGQPPV